MGTNQIRQLVAVVGLGLIIPLQTRAQQSSDRRGALTGTVVDVATNKPLELARVTLVPVPAGALTPTVRESGFLLGSRTVLTDTGGVYRFPDISSGTYRLHIRRIGYRAASLDLELEGTEGLSLSVGLTVAPIRLEPLTAVSPPIDMYTEKPAERDPTWDRVDRERWRQETFLETDVRMVAEEDVTEAITLGEEDILRALQRLPGISTRDDWTAGLWVRGAPSAHTRVYFDGLPLFNPVHAGGLLSAIGADGVGAVFLHPGVRSVEMGAGAAGVVDIKSRSAGGEGDLRGRARITSSNIGLALDKRWRDGTVGTLVAARRSWLNRTRDLVKTTEGVSPEIPNDYADGVARFDVDLGHGRGVEASGIWERDWIDGFLAGGPAANRSSWGTLAGRGTFHTPLFGGLVRQSVGVSWFGADVRQIGSHTPLEAFDSLPVQEPTDNDVLYLSASGEWTRYDDNGVGPKWRLGYNLFRETVQYHGAPPRPYSIPTYLYTANVEGRVVAANIWGERYFRPSDKLSVRAGIRLEIDAEKASNLFEPDITRTNAGGFTEQDLAPQITIRYTPTDRLSVALATGTYFQYEQAIAPSGLSFGPQLSVSPVWWLPLHGTTRSAARTQMNTLGLEYWMGDEWLASANYFDRSTQGLAIADPGPGPIEDDAFLVTADNQANGIEFTLRRLVGRWTAAVAYTLAVSNYELADGRRFPAPSDRRHVIDASAMTRISDRIIAGTMRVGATFSAASGAPYTRLHPGVYDCSGYIPYGNACAPIVPTIVESPNAERSPWSSRFNVLIDWGRSFTQWDIAAHIQVQNLLNAPRAVTYAVDAQSCRRLAVDSPYCGPGQDRFLPGLRRHYELGLRLAF
jgi:hypothetical protein